MTLQWGRKMIGGKNLNREKRKNENALQKVGDT
jgi:hypothetical protein